MASDRGPGAATDRGSVLVLMPAAVIVLLVLASLAVDRALVFGAQRDLVATAQAAANDAVAAGVDPDELRGTGAVVLDPVRVEQAVRRATLGVDADLEVRWAIRGTSVVVELSRTVPYVFSPAVPGGRRTERLSARSQADLRRR
ncbi:MAG: hypothetical protein R2746_00900 [Acidimicrobiales bacterium]|nr:hypothetical protein [Actinomycetota bacterium]